MKNPMRVPAAFECAAQLMIDDPLKHGKSEALGFRGGQILNARFAPVDRQTAIAPPAPLDQKLAIVAGQCSKSFGIGDQFVEQQRQGLAERRIYQNRLANQADTSLVPDACVQLPTDDRMQIRAFPYAIGE